MLGARTQVTAAFFHVPAGFLDDLWRRCPLMEAKYREEDDAGAGFVGYLDSVRDAQRALFPGSADPAQFPTMQPPPTSRERAAG